MSEATVINESCQNAVWPNVGSLYPQIDSFAALKGVFDNWSAFNAADLEAVRDPNNVQILASSVFQSAVPTIHFSVNGKEGLTYLWARNYGKTQDGPTTTEDFGHSNGKAMLLIPGSGDNEGCGMMGRIDAYHDNLFPIGCAVGDAFIYEYPGEDMRALVGENGKKLLRASIENYLYIKGTSLTNLVLIELAAAMKWLRGSYSKIGIMGISKGAGEAALAALYTNPDAVVSASGFSLKQYRSLGYGSLGGNIIPSVEQVWDQTTLTNAIKASTSKWLYTCSSDGNEGAMMLEEAATDETGNALAGPNFHYLKHSQGHVYPMPDTLAWLQNAMA